jgi:hypothetical protein
MSASLASRLAQLVLDPQLRKLRFRLALAMYAAILVLGSIPGARAEIGLLARGIILHTIAYGVLSFLLFTGSLGSPAARAGKTVLTVALMGALDETIQSFLPYRTGAVADFLVDCNAAVLSCALLWAFLPAPAENR